MRDLGRQGPDRLPQRGCEKGCSQYYGKGQVDGCASSKHDYPGKVPLSICASHDPRLKQLQAIQPGTPREAHARHQRSIAQKQPNQLVTCSGYIWCMARPNACGVFALRSHTFRRQGAFPAAEAPHAKTATTPLPFKVHPRATCKGAQQPQKMD